MGLNETEVWVGASVETKLETNLSIEGLLSLSDGGEYFPLFSFLECFL